MKRVEADQGDLQCPNCAGQCRYSPVAQGLHCTMCDAVHSLDTADDHLAAAEFPYDVDLPDAEPPLPQVKDLSDTRAHQCLTCGGEVLFTGPALSEHCPYCDGAVVLSDQDSGYQTKALIPFKADQDFAQRQALDWVAGRLAAPGDLNVVVSQARVAGLYAPFWTFDSTEAVEYWAKYTTGSGDNRRTRSLSGHMRIHFDDVLMPASPHVTPLIRDGILHEFNPSDLRPYRAGYLAGFAAERHHQTVDEGLRANGADKTLLMRNRIKQHINKSGVHSIRYQTDTTGIHYRRILLPVWILHYTYGGTPMKVVVSGIDGRTFGERPFSKWKIAGYSAALAAMTIAFGIAWGAGGLL